MKLALCFIISYNHTINKEKIWRDWIEPNKDIINIYFHYKQKNLIKSNWIKIHCIPEKCISPTTYYHVVPAYISVLSFAFSHDINNKWFCLLTESCVPIISPELFRKIFMYYHHASIIGIKPAYWNIDIHHRANLRLLHKDYHLANDPWFTLTRDHVHKTILFMIKKQNIYQSVCKGGLANESIFAIILKTFNEINNKFTLINTSSTISDWSRMENVTSPHVFKNDIPDVLEKDKNFIYNELKKNKFVLFLRKVKYDYPDDILLEFIYNTDLKHEYIQVNEYKYKYRGIFFLFFLFGLFIIYLYYSDCKYCFLYSSSP